MEVLIKEEKKSMQSRQQPKNMSKKKLSQNAPQISVDKMIQTTCCKKICVKELTSDFILSLRKRLATLTYEEQNLYLPVWFDWKEGNHKNGWSCKKEAPSTWVFRYIITRWVCYVTFRILSALSAHIMKSSDNDHHITVELKDLY